MKKTIKEMEQALKEINFFVGGLSDDGIEHYYGYYKANGKIK